MDKIEDQMKGFRLRKVAIKCLAANIHVVSGFERTNSLPENQSVCLSLWVSILPVVMKSQSNMEIFYYLKQRWYNSKATGEQTTKGLKPIR